MPLHFKELSNLYLFPLVSTLLLNCNTGEHEAALCARRAYIAFTRAVDRAGVFRSYLPKPERVWMKPGMKARGHNAHSHKKLGEIA